VIPAGLYQKRQGKKTDHQPLIQVLSIQVRRGEPSGGRTGVGVRSQQRTSFLSWRVQKTRDAPNTKGGGAPGGVGTINKEVVSFTNASDFLPGKPGCDK